MTCRADLIQRCSTSMVYMMMNPRKIAYNEIADDPYLQDHDVKYPYKKYQK